MFSKFQTFIVACLCVFCLLLGGGVVHSCDQGKVPKTDSTVSVSVAKAPPVHDTLFRDRITVQRVAAPPSAPRYVHDTVLGRPDSARRPDSATCYTVVKDTAGAHIDVQLCSDSLPRHKPLDLVATIFYQAPACTSKTVHLQTTITKPGPFLTDWRVWAIAVAALAVGAYAGHQLK